MLADFAAAHTGRLATGEEARAEVLAAAAAALAALLGEVRERAGLWLGTGLQCSVSSPPGEHRLDFPSEVESPSPQSVAAVAAAAAAAAVALAGPDAAVEFGEADFTADFV